MRVKIHRGTAATGEPLCQTCRYATIIRGHKLGDEIVECERLSFRNQRVRFPVTYCTGYADRRQASLREMEEIAWVLRTDPRRREIGFVHSSKLEDDDRFVLDE